MYHASSLDDACSHNGQLSETVGGVACVRGVCCGTFSHHIFSSEPGRWLVLDSAQLRLPP